MRVPVRKRSYEIQDYCFPTTEHREEYLSNVQNVPESEVKALLRMFLIPNGALGIDSTTRKFLISQRKDDLPHLMQTNEFIRRLFSTLGAWQGISWVLARISHTGE